MSTTTEKYGFLKPDPNDFYDVKEDISDNMDKVEEALSEFDDSGSVEGIKNFPDFLSKFLSGNKLATTLRNLKAGLQFVLHAGQIVNNCVTDNAGLPLSAAQGKVLKDLYTQLYSDLNTTNNNLSNKADKTSLSSYALKSDFPNYFKFLRIEADQSSYGTEVLEHISSLNNTGFIIYCEHGSVSMYMGFIVGNGKYGTVLRFEYDSLYINGCSGDVWAGWTKLG